MPSPLDELRADMEAAVLKARRAGMRYDAIRAEVATVGDRVRMAQRAHVLDHDRRDEMQPRLTGEQLAHLPRGRKDVLRVGFRPMGALVDSVMPGARP